MHNPVRRLYETCVRCHLMVAVLNDNRIGPHRRPDNTGWCDGAHRPDPKEVLARESFGAEQHRMHHQELYRALRELIEDWCTQTGKKPQDIDLLTFTGWCRRQHDAPDHDNIGPHF